jgi:hypothetical protein
MKEIIGIITISTLSIAGCSCVLFDQKESTSFNQNDTIESKENKSTDLILWSPDVVLTWDDFQGTPDDNKYVTALTYTKVSMKPIEQYEDSILYEITNSFIRNKSWSKDKNSELLLTHERLHFDITEIIARNIRKAFTELYFNEVIQNPKILSDVFRLYTIDHRNQINDSYDDETKLGTIEVEQQKWNEWVQKELEELKEYESTLVVIRK